MAKAAVLMARCAMNVFPNLQPDVYKGKVVDIFKQIATDLASDVLFKVINDGEATALTAYQTVNNHGNVLGIFLGSSEGAGYANADGNSMGWTSELCWT